MVSVDQSGSGARSSSLLDILVGEGWESLRRQMTQRRYEAGDCLLAQSTLQPDFEIIVDGVASVSALRPQGERVELSRLGRGDCIGEIALLTGEPASADVHAITTVETYAIAQTDLSELGQERARLIEVLSVILAGRLRRANERLLTMRQASINVVDMPMTDASLLAHLPNEMAQASGGRVLVVVGSEPFNAPGFLESIAADNVDIEIITEGASEVRSRLHNVAHRYGQIILFANPDVLSEVARDADTVLRVQQEDGAQPHAASSGAKVIVVSDQPWTHANLLKLSARFGEGVLGVLPPQGTQQGSRLAVAKLGRALTGRRVGVALGAGAAKGFAHIGVLRAFNELGVPVDVVTGSSIGAAIAAGYAAGLSTDELSETATRIATKARRFTVPLYSFLSNHGIRDELQTIGADKRFDELDLPLAVVATDIYRRCQVTFTSGVVWPCVLASMAIPGIYPPLRSRGSYLVDGGVLNPVPADQARAIGAGVVIGVRLTGKSTAPRTTLDVAPSRPLTTETIMRSMEIMNNRISEISNDQADVTIEVALEGGGLADFKRGKEYMERGYQATMEAAEALAAAVPIVRGAP